MESYYCKIELMPIIKQEEIEESKMSDEYDD
jgi:hypothetical protein